MTMRGSHSQTFPHYVPVYLVMGISSMLSMLQIQSLNILLYIIVLYINIKLYIMLLQIKIVIHKKNKNDGCVYGVRPVYGDPCEGGPKKVWAPHPQDFPPQTPWTPQTRPLHSQYTGRMLSMLQIHSLNILLYIIVYYSVLQCYIYYYITLKL